VSGPVLDRLDLQVADVACAAAGAPQRAARRANALEPEARHLIADAADRGGMSARGIHRALRVTHHCGPCRRGAD
jgi:hypothetical protein